MTIRCCLFFSLCYNLGNQSTENVHYYRQVIAIVKRICICYFSGTGMTQYVVNKLSDEILKSGHTIECFRIEDIQSEIDVAKYDLFGIAYPVHAFTTPKIVVDFVNRLVKADELDTFIIGTMGERSPVNYAASDTLIRKLTSKGYRVFYNQLFEMPSNFMIKYEDSKVQKILSNVSRDIPDIAKDIINHKAYRINGNPAVRFLSVIGKAEWLGAPVMGKFFYANSDCNLCGRCIRKCPKQNIVNKGEALHFKWKCSLCMRCVYQCPKQAINIHQPFKFIQLPAWYDKEYFR